MRKLQSCGVLLFRDAPKRSFLLMKHPHRYDLPKGHQLKNESETECALRELFEETGLSDQEIKLDPDFRFTETYYPRYRRYGGEQVEKTIVIFLGYLKGDADIRTAEHPGYEWIEWNPPHRIQANTIDPLLAEAEKHFGSRNRRR